MSTIKLLVSDQVSMALPPARSCVDVSVERGRSAASAACPPTPLVVSSHRDHRGGDRLGPGWFVASGLPTRPPALAEIDADDLTGRGLHARHLIPRQLRPDAVAVRQRQLDSVVEPKRDHAFDGGGDAPDLIRVADDDLVRADIGVADAVDLADEAHHELGGGMLVELDRGSYLLDTAMV